MLNNLKGKFLTSTNTQAKRKEFINGNTVPLEYRNAGADILKHFQDQWVELHALNEDNISSIRTIAKQVKEVHAHTEKQKNDFILLNEWITSIPYLTENLVRCAECLRDMYSVCDNVEGGLLTLEHLIKNIESETKNVDKQTLESVMSKKLTLTEAGSCSSEQDLDHKTIEEKRKIYQEAFYTDLENFKKSGTIPESKKLESENVSLEDIQIECNTQELENFLDDP